MLIDCSYDYRITTWINKLGAESFLMIRKISIHKIKGQII